MKHKQPRSTTKRTTTTTAPSTRKGNVMNTAIENILVPLNKLAVSPANVRKTGGTKIDDLAAMIESQGLLNRLTVVPATCGKKGHYEVAAGGRRLRALTLLAEQKKLAKDAPIECKLVHADAATAASLAENIAREAMHPADQYLAFQALVTEGKSIADVAASFGISELTVSRRLKLAQVSPRLFELYRDDKMTLAQLMQFTLTDDHEKQERVWKTATQWQRDPRHLRELLTKGELSSGDPLVKFVGMGAYKKAGGVVRADLFSGKDGGLITDAALLNELAVAKLEITAGEYRAAGWRWVEARPQCDHGELAVFRKASQGRRDPTAAEKKELASLEKKMAAMNLEIEALENCDEDHDEGDALEDLYQSQGKLEDTHERFLEKLAVWSSDQIALCGVIVSVDHDGKACAHEGLVRPEDQKDLKRTVQAKAVAGGDSEAIKAEHSERLTRALTAHRNAAMQALLLQHPDVALVTVVHTLALGCFDAYQTAFINDPVKIRATTVRHAQRTAAPDIDQSKAGGAFAQAWAAWEARLPTDGKELFAWLLPLPIPELHSLLTLCVAASLDTIASRDVKGLPGEGLAAVLGLNMADWWKPTAEGYLNHIPKSQIIAAVTAAKSADEAKKLPSKGKAELVAAAEIVLRETSWLPGVLRA